MEGSVKMSEKVNAGDHPKNDSAQQRRLYEQFEFAKQIYAAHRLLVNVPPLDGQKIGAFIHERLAGFTAARGRSSNRNQLARGGGARSAQRKRRHFELRHW